MLGLADAEPYEEVPETGPTFADNALLKARDGAEATGLPTVADDSGLAVDALNGMPGVFSAAGPAGTATTRATWSCCSPRSPTCPTAGEARRSSAPRRWPRPTGGQFVVEGRMPGRLVRRPRGHGFGYDPIFVADGQDRTNAELPPAEKDAISHRGKAMRAITPYLVQATRGARLISSFDLKSGQRIDRSECSRCSVFVMWC